MPTRRTFIKGLGVGVIAGAFCPIELAPKLFALPTRQIEIVPDMAKVRLVYGMTHDLVPFAYEQRIWEARPFGM